MDEELEFHAKLGIAIQKWIWVESELRSLYAAIMAGANLHMISATFHEIQSVEVKLRLIDTCFALLFSKKSEEGRNWKELYDRVKKLNIKRNKIVHQPVIQGQHEGFGLFYIAPSFLNSLAVAKGLTKHDGPVVFPDYSPSKAKLRKEHKIDFIGLSTLDTEFRTLADDLHNFCLDVSPKITQLYKDALKKT
ncbi:MAG: hypothetical protein ABL994_16360 [Verrucomicrobiales bacterium]